MKKRTYLYKAGFACAVISLFMIKIIAQSVVGTFTYNPPGLTNNVGFNIETAVVNSTGLVYVGTSAAYGNEIGVIDPATNTMSHVISVPTPGVLNFSRVNQTTGLVYFRQQINQQPIVVSNIVVVDGRPASPTFNQALPSIGFPGRQINSFALDESRGRLYVTSVPAQAIPPPPLQSIVSIVDVDPASATFHQVINQVLLPPGSFARGIAVNSVTNKIYIGVPGGPFVLNGATMALTIVTPSFGGFGVVVNENNNMVYATGPGNAVRAIDGNTDHLLTLIPVPATLTATSFDEKIAVNKTTGRVYVQSAEDSVSAKLIAIDGNRTSPSFNTVVGMVNIGRGAGQTDIVIDETLNRVVTCSLIDRITTIVDGATTTSLSVIPTSQAASDVALNPVTHQVFVANQLNFVQAIDLSVPALSATIITGVEAGPGVLNPNNHLYYGTRATDITDIPIFGKCGAKGVVGGLPHNNGRYGFPLINGATNRVYAFNISSNLAGDTYALPGYVSVIDGHTNQAVANVAVGNQPFGGAVNEVTNKIYILNSGFGPTFPSGITILDGATNTVTNADVSAFSPLPDFVLQIAVNEITNKIYFEYGGIPGNLGVLDGATGSATPLSTLFGPVAAIRVNKVLNRVYVGTNTGLLNVIDGSTNALMASLTIGAPGAPGERFRSVVVDEQTGRVYVCDAATNMVTVVDGNTNTIVTTIPVGAGPTAVGFNSLTNRLYVGNTADNSVSFIDCDSLTVASTLSISVGPKSLDVDPATSRIYISSADTPDESGVVILSDTHGTFDALRKAIIAATAGDPPGIRNSMLTKVDGAENALDHGKELVAGAKLLALGLEVEAQRGKKVTSAEAQQIITLIATIANSVC